MARGQRASRGLVPGSHSSQCFARLGAAICQQVADSVARSAEAGKYRPDESETLEPDGTVRSRRTLARVAARDSLAAEQVLSQSDSWIGKTRRTPSANQLITVALDQHDVHVRPAALQTDLAMDGYPRDANGLNLLKTAAGPPNQRAWARWSLGGLGNRGVDPEQTAEIIESYLGDRDARVRMAAVNGLAILRTDQTIPVLLDRFRNDSSALVQEQAACGLGESNLGMNPTARQHWYKNSR
jgi:hypothetical protein